jgi:serine phosphatase RsbU (regulator of sigma subunit)
MLPTEKDIKLIVPDSFVYFLPKDIVSGDFYWVRKMKDLLFIAVADCTGHGVPGAFMSMIGTDRLNFALQEKKLIKPSDILYELNNGVKEALKQNETGSTSRDGMDIALCVIDENKRILNYSGANRMLYKISKGVLTDYAPTKSAIGGFTPLNFTFQDHQISFEKGDMFYMFSDGFADQFGGPKGKKYMIKKLKSCLLNIANDSLEMQKEKIGKEFHSWKGSHEQVDDVLVIGVRV